MDNTEILLLTLSLNIVLSVVSFFIQRHFLKSKADLVEQKQVQVHTSVQRLSIPSLTREQEEALDVQRSIQNKISAMERRDAKRKGQG